MTKDIESKIFVLLNKLAIPCHLKGRAYIETAIDTVMKKNVVSMKREIYPEIGRRYKVTASSVERAIRYAITSSLLNADIDFIDKVFGSALAHCTGRVTNLGFIHGVKKYLELSFMEEQNG